MLSKPGVCYSVGGKQQHFPIYMGRPVDLLNVLAAYGSERLGLLDVEVNSFLPYLLNSILRYMVYIFGMRELPPHGAEQLEGKRAQPEHKITSRPLPSLFWLLPPCDVS
jgi:hypothetical protein